MFTCNCLQRYDFMISVLVYHCWSVLTVINYQVKCKNFIILLACIGYMLRTCCVHQSCVVCCTDVKQRRLFSPVAVAESGNVIAIAPSSSVTCENTEIEGEQMRSVSVKSEDLTASTSAVVTGNEETAQLTEYTEHPVASPVADNVNASMSQLSLVSDTDTAPPVSSSVAEPVDAKMQQLTAVTSEIAAATGEDAAASITSNDVSVNNPEVLRSSMQLAAASMNEQTEQAQLQQHVAVNSQDTEAGCGDQTSTDVDGVASSHASVYETDVAIYKQQGANSNDAGDTAGGKQEARSDSMSETFITCAALSPGGSDSVFHSPQSNFSDNRNTSNNESSSAQKPQGVQHSSGDAVMTPSQSKLVIYNRCDSSVVGERKETESERTQSMLSAESKTDKDAVNCHSENSMVVESEEQVESGDNRDKDSEVEGDDDDEEEDKISDDVKQDESAAGEKMAVEPQENKNEASSSAKAQKKNKKRRKKKQQNKQSHSAEVEESESSNSAKNVAEKVESYPIARPPEMQSDTVNRVRQTASETTKSAAVAENRESCDDADADANVTNDTASHQSTQDTADVRGNQQKHVQTASTPGTSDAKVCTYSIFDVLY